MHATYMQRHAYRLKAGSLANLQLTAEQLPDPELGEVTIAVKAIGLNFADIFAIWGLYGATPDGEFVPGLEYSGVVDRVGEGITHLRQGDKIMGVIRFGAYATHLNIDARYVSPNFSLTQCPQPALCQGWVKPANPPQGSP